MDASDNPAGFHLTPEQAHALEGKVVVKRRTGPRNGTLMDLRLIELLVCPLCKGPLELAKSETHTELICPADHLAFPVRDGIPVMLESEARSLNQTPA